MLLLLQHQRARRLASASNQSVHAQAEPSDQAAGERLAVLDRLAEPASCLVPLSRDVLSINPLVWVAWNDTVNCNLCAPAPQMRALGAGGAGGPSAQGTAAAAGAGSGGVGPPAADAYDEHKWGTVRHLCGVAVYQEEEVGRRIHCRP